LLSYAARVLRRVLAIAALTGALLAGGCGGDEESTGLVFEDPRGTLDVEKGMRFTVELSVNASVGNDWVPEVPDSKGPVLLRGTKVDYPDEDRDGDSGVKQFLYEARATGRGTIVLRKLFRGDQQERRTITVNVRG
jgi:predicted secreted protein